MSKDAHLLDDIGLDSFNVMNMIVLIEELGVHLPDDVVVRLETFGDVYAAYAERATRLDAGR